MSRPAPRLLALVGLLLTPAVLLAATGGPDGGDYVYTDSNESDGPTHATLTLDDATDLGLGDDDTADVTLPFDFTIYSNTYDEVTISSNGVIYMQGASTTSAGSCTTSGNTWRGVAAFWDDLAAGTVKYQTFGRYPYRAFVVDWEAEHASVTGGSTASFQAWLTEGRDEIVVAYKDLTFGDPAYDGGINAIMGTANRATSGLSYSCSGVVSAGTSVWYGSQGGRPSSDQRETDDLDTSWTGTDTRQYLGRTLATGDLNADGLSDLIVGNQDDDRAWVVLGSAGTSGSEIDDANARITGNSGDESATALATLDLDGDGYDDLVIGAPLDDTTDTNAGAVFIYEGENIEGNLQSGSDEDLAVYAAATTSGFSGTEKKQTGAALASGDIDGDGYVDLLIGAPRDNGNGANSGAVYALMGGVSAFSTGTMTLDGSPFVLQGEAAQDRAGTAVHVADLDNDGIAEIMVGAPYNDPISGNDGSVFVMLGGSLSGTYDLGADSQFELNGPAADASLGTAISTGDMDGDGYLELVAATTDYSYTVAGGGAVYLYMGVSTYAGAYTDTDASLFIYGDVSSQGIGESLGLHDMNEDGFDDLIIGSPDDNTYNSGGGTVGIFLASGTLTGTTAFSSRDKVLYGSKSVGALGTAFVVAEDMQGDGRVDLIASAPYQEADSVTGAGAVYLWTFAPDFLDSDGDGFVSTSVGGTDCDDEDSAVNLEQAETAGNLTDDDCDGWVDDVVIVRGNQEYWEYDLEAELNSAAYDTFDFEDGTEGSSGASLYTADGLTLSTSGTEVVATTAWGSSARDDLCLRITASSTTNDLVLEFDEDVDAVGFWVLDGEDELEIDLEGGGTALISAMPVAAEGNDKANGTFLGFTFSESIDTLTIVAGLSDAIGVDDIYVVWADDTDRDGDGYTDNEGDCEDDNPEVNPGATEVLGNSVDDDCDGVVDAGDLDTYTDYSTWSADAAADEQEIDFEDLSAGETVDDDYEDVGVTFDGTLDVVTDVDGSAPVDSQGAEAAGSSLTITFEEDQPAVALTILDGSGDFTFTAYIDGVEAYSWTVDMAAEDTAGGVFTGAIFDLGIDELLVESDSSSDTWGMDDLIFHVLGLDDADGDGYTEADGDCDDSDADTNPDATEVYYDGVDSDCDGESDYDEDGDGHDSSDYGGDDCDDGDADISPDATEVYYDGVDQDCDGASDYDSDLDGHDSATYGGSDCDDESDAISPDASETYYDGVDDNCDPTDDDDADGDGYSVSGTASGELGGGDCDDTDADIGPDATEVWYDGVDQDCDEASDYDQDGDGTDAEAYGGTDCGDLDADVYLGAPGEICYDGVDQDCDDASDYDCDEDGYDSEDYGGLDCDDTDSAINPDATDTWGDGIDSDCDGAAEFDDDGDGYDGVEDGGTDCDDDDASIYPGATETWYDGVDQDCDEASDYDQDGDGYDSDAYGGTDCDDTDGSINPGVTDYWYDGIDADCDGSDDYDADGDGYASTWYAGTDCDDGDADVNPGATEIFYDGVDSDCDGLSDYDADEDGYDSDAYGGTDCDDGDGDIHPYATETPLDGVDQNCDGFDDWDADEDGSLATDDCDDSDPSVFPGATEICYDGVDQDCDEASDYDCDGDTYDADAHGGTDCDDTDAATFPGAPEVWYDGKNQDCGDEEDFDRDGDGHLPTSWGGDDCDDNRADVHGGNTEDPCGGGDEDCDGTVDEDCVAGDEGGDDGGEEGGEEGGDEGGDEGGEEGGADEGAGEGTDDTASPTQVVEPADGYDPGLLEGGCGACSTGGSNGAGGLAGLALLGLLGLRRRRDS